jgi:hypothetical protein
MKCGAIVAAWAGVENTVDGTKDVVPGGECAPSIGLPFDDRLACATDPFDDFDEDDFDDDFDDDFEEEWDEELPGDADQFEPDEVEEQEEGVPVDPDFEDED